LCVVEVAAHHCESAKQNSLWPRFLPYTVNSM
jgi:hypothetical protein